MFAKYIYIRNLQIQIYIYICGEYIRAICFAVIHTVLRTALLFFALGDEVPKTQPRSCFNFLPYLLCVVVL